MTRVSPPRVASSRAIGDRIVTDWHRMGSCWDDDVDPDLFYHPEGERGSQRMRRERQAKEICSKCPVMQMCRDAARSRREQYGLWGGETEFERSRYMVAVRRASA